MLLLLGLWFRGFNLRWGGLDGCGDCIGIVVVGGMGIGDDSCG